MLKPDSARKIIQVELRNVPRHSVAYKITRQEALEQAAPFMETGDALRAWVNRYLDALPETAFAVDMVKENRYFERRL